MATYYVDPTSGNDSTGDGTSALPWLTVSKANTESTTGDTIVIKSGTHTMTESTMSNFTQSRTYTGQTVAGVNVTILDLDGSFMDRVPLGSNGATINFNNLNIININTTDLSLITTSSVFTIGFTGMTLSLSNIKVNNVALGSNAATNTAGWYGCLFGTEFVSSGALEGTIITMSRCEFGNMGQVSGTSVGCSGFFGSYVVDAVDLRIYNCTFDVTDPGFGGGQISHLFGSRQFQNLVKNQSVIMRNSIAYMTSGSCALTIHQATYQSTYSFVLDANYSDNVLYGTWTLDSDATYSVSNCQTVDPKFVNPTTGDYRLRPDLTTLANTGASL